MKKIYFLLVILFSVFQSYAQFGALDFDGSNDYVPVNATGFPINSSSYTIEAWIKPDAMGTKGIIGWGTYGTENAVNALRLTDTGIMNYWWGNDIQATTGSLVGAWHHVAVTCSSTERNLYLDGNLIGSGTVNSSQHVVPNAGNVTIGRTNAGEYFDGQIDNVRVWRTARTQAQIQAGMTATYPSFTANLSAFYDFNQTSGDVLPEFGNANTNYGYLQNFALSGSTSNWTLPANTKIIVNNAAGYTTLKDAFDAINAGMHTGAISMVLIGDTTETSTPTLNASGIGASSYTSLAIVPRGGRMITCQTNVGITFNGADNVSISGAAFGTGLTIYLADRPITISNNADNVSIGSCYINTNGSPESVINITGSSNTTVNNCFIGGTGTGKPQWGISLATVNNARITGNRIFDFYSNTSKSAGIMAGNDVYDTQLNYNRIYKTQPATTANEMFGIYVSSNVINATNPGLIIAENVVGYGEGDLTGIFTINSPKFAGISYTANAGSNAATIRDNIVSGIAWTARTGVGSTFRGIEVLDGSTSVTGNTIGSISDNNAITITSPATNLHSFAGIYKMEGGNSIITNNNIGGISASGSSRVAMYGIYATQGSSGSYTATCTGNTIGGTAANSITTLAPGPDGEVVGLTLLMGGSAVSNTIRNLTGNGARVNGIVVEPGASLSSVDVSSNTIHNLANTNTTDATLVRGIQQNYTNSSASGFIASYNHIHSLFSFSNNPAARIDGITVRGRGFTVSNNMIALGAQVSKSIAINGIFANYQFAQLGSAFKNNSVYIGGVQFTGSSSSCALNISNLMEKEDIFLNNILVNNRANNGASASHRSIAMSFYINNSGAVQPVTKSNIYYGNGAGYILGNVNSNAIATLAELNDVTNDLTPSYFSDPKFLAPTATVPDLHISTTSPTVVEGHGTDAGLAQDIDTQTRSGLTPHDIGADAGNFSALPVPSITSVSATSACVGSSVEVTGTSLADVTAAYIGSTPVTITSLTDTSATLATGSTTASGYITLSNALYSAVSTQTFNVYNPQITAQPQNSTMCNGNTATFSVTATGALSYQWRCNGVNIPDGALYSGTATSTLTIPNAGYGLTGSRYDCIISSGPCAILSTTGVLTVNLPPAPVVQATKTMLCNGESATLSAAHSSPALQFDGVNDYFSISRRISADFTVEFWVKTTLAGASGTQWYDGTGLVDGAIPSVAADFGISLMGGKIAFGMGGIGGGLDTTIFSTTNVNTGTWIHVAATREKGSGVFKLYINGHEEASATGNTFDLASYSVHIGNNTSYSGHFNGSLDDIRLWTVARSQNQIRAGMLRSMPNNMPGLVDNLLLNEGQGTSTNNHAPFPTYTYISGNPVWTTRNNVPLHGNYAWSTGAATAEIATGTAGSYTVTVTDANSCSATSPAIEITQIVVPVEVTPASPGICSGGSGTTLTASGANTYTWSPATGLSPTTGAAVTANPTATTTYTVTGTAANGCTGTKTVTVTVNAPSVINISGTTTICNGTGTTLTVSGASSYSWSPATGLSATTGTTVTASPAATTIYTVTGTNASGCTTTKQVTVTVNASSPVYVNGITSICPGNSTTLTVSGALSYSWSPAGGLSATTGAVVTANPLATTTYTVTGTNANGCTSTSQVTVTVNTTANPVIIASATGFCQGGSAVLTATNQATTPALLLTNGTNFWLERTIANDFTIEFWVRTIQQGTTGTNWFDGVGIIDSEYGGVVNDFGISLMAGKIGFGIGNHVGGDRTLISAASVNTGQWVHVAVTRTRTTGNFAIYINGVLDSQMTGTNTSFLNSSATITIGRVQGSNNYFNGSLDDVRMWSVVRSPQDILNNMYKTYGPGTANLNNHFTFNSGSGNTAFDTGVVTNGNPFINSAGWTTHTSNEPVTSVVWSNGATTPQITVSETGSHTVTVTNTEGCSTVSPPLEVTAFALPTINISPAISAICSGTDTVLTASGASTYAWTPATGLSATTGATVTASPTTTTAYTVTGTSANGCISTKQITVTVNTPGAINISGTTTICPGAQTTLTASGSQSYSWSPATGLSATTGASVTANPLGNTTYIVTGTDANGCTSTREVTVTVNPLPVIAISGNDTICAGGGTVLTASGGESYTWSPATGLSAAYGESVIANPSATTTYTVTGTDSNGCSGSAAITVTVNSPSDITVTGNTTICPGSETTLTASGSVTYNWSPATGLSATTGAIVTASPSATTTYTVTGTDANGCTAADQVTVTVNPQPAIEIDGNDTICAGGETVLTASGGESYIWSPETGLSTADGASVTANPSATTTYTVTGTDANGCSGSAEITVTVNSPSDITISGNTTICAGSETTLTASGSYTYIWSPATGLSASTGEVVTANPSETTTYRVTGTDSNGCTVTKDVTVTVNPLPVIDILGNDVICEGGATLLTATGGVNYSWTPATGLDNTTGASVTASPAVSTLYTVTATAANGCTATRSVMINIGGEAQPATISASGPVVICNDQSVVLSAPQQSVPALQFNNGYFGFANPIPGNFTIEVWLKTTDPGHQFMQKSGMSLSTSYGRLNVTQVGQPAVISQAAINTGEWVHIAITRNVATGEIKLYINGILDTSAIRGTSVYSGGTMYVGGNANFGMDNIRIWNTIRTSAEVAYDMFATYAPTSGLVANFELDGNGATVINSVTSEAVEISGNYSWTSRDYYPYNGYLWSNGATTPSITVTEGDIYSLQVANTAGCLSEASNNIAVTEKTIEIAGTTTICHGGSTTLTASGADGYLWSPSTGLNTNSGSTVTASPTVTTTYTVTWGTYDGCQDTKQVTLTVLPAETPVITASAAGICPDGSTTLTASTASSPALMLNNATSFLISREIADDFTIEFWIKTTDPGLAASNWYDGTGIIDAEVGGIANDFGISLANGKIAFGVGGGGSDSDLTLFSNSAVNTGGWVHVGVTRKKSTGAVAIYMNGILDSQGVSMNINSLSASSTLPIGRVQGGAFLNASLDDIKIWDVVRLQEDIVADSYTDYPAAPSGLVSQFTFNQGSGNIAVNTGISPNDGTIISPGWDVRNALSADSILWSNGATTPSIIVTEGGSYTATITNSNGCTSESQPVILTAYDPVLVTISPSGNTVCAGTENVLTASGAATYSWSPAAGLSATTGASVIANPLVTTVYTVTGTSADGCTGTAQVTVHVPVISIQGHPFVCDGVGTELTATGGVSYTWSPATGLDTTTGAVVTATPEEDTTYTVTATTSNGCTATQFVFVQKVAKPAAPLINASSTTICAGGTVTLSAQDADLYTQFLWSNGATSSSITVSQGGSYTLRAAYAGGCFSELSEPIILNVINDLQLSGDYYYICPGESVVLSASGSDSYSWLGYGLSATSGATVTATPRYSGSYYVTGTTDGCTIQKYIIIDIKQDLYFYPEAALVCQGENVELRAGGLESYSWSPASGLDTTTGGTVSASPQETTTYTVTGLNEQGCTVTNSITVTVSAPITPAVAASGSLSLCEGSSVTLSVPDFATGTAASFNGNSNTAIPLTATDDFTIEYWMKTTAVGAVGLQWWQGTTILDADLTYEVTNDFGTSLLGSKLAFGIGNPDKTIVSQSDVNTGQWVHIAVTRNKESGVFELYINGIMEASYIGENHNSLDGNAMLYIGHAPLSSQFIGAFDELRIWSTVRTTAQIQEGMTAGYPEPVQGLVSSYTFDEGTGVDFTDAVTGAVINVWTPYWIPDTFTWIQRPVTGDYSNVQWSTGATTGEITINEAGTYTVTATTPQGCSATSEPIVVTVSSGGAPAGTISAAQDVCSGAEPSDITVSDYSGTIIKWQKSTNEEFTDAADISYTGDTLPSSIIGSLTETTYFRAVTDSGCAPNSESTLIIVGAATIWDGDSWSNGEPTSSIGAIITGDFSSDGNLFACTLTIIGDVTVTVNSGDYFYIKGKITVDPGALLLFENTAHLMQEETTNTNVGNAEVHRNSAQLYRQDYTMWSSPVDGQEVRDFSAETLINRFYTYSPEGNNLVSMFANEAAADGVNFEAGTGYLIRMPNGAPQAGYVEGTTSINYDGTFTGTPNNGDIAKTVTPASPGVLGYNAIGNPYPSPISVEAFFAGNQGNTDGIMYLWRRKNGAALPSAYCTVNSDNEYVDNQQPETENPNGILQAGQGFIVKALTGTVNFNNDMRTADGEVDGSFFRMNNSAPPTAESHRIWLNLHKDATPIAQMLVGYKSNATMGIDMGIDAPFINDVETGLNSILDDKAYAIQGRSLPFDNQDVVPLQFKTEVAGSYSIAIDHVDGLFSGNQDIFLKDNLLNITHDIKASNYSFTSDAGVFNDRFEIVYVENALGTNEPEIDANTIIIYKQQRNIIINSGTAVMANVKIFDPRGRLVYEKENINASETVISDLRAEEQMLIVQVTTVENAKVSKKVIY